MKKLSKMIRILSVAILLCGFISEPPQIQHPERDTSADDHGGGHN